MGSGKSSIGRRLAALTGHRFVDTDELIVQAEGRSISDVFAAEGESYFREAEERVLRDLVGVCGVILSTGGGIVLREANRAILHEIGIVAWLDAEPDALFERASRSNKRPLLQTANPRETFDALLTSRRAIYEETAEFRVDSTGAGHDAVAQMVLDEAMRAQARR
jgi:shikimate kinase